MYINSQRAVSFFCGTKFLQHGGVMEKNQGWFGLDQNQWISMV
jgi:hypothetical protein